MEMEKRKPNRGKESFNVEVTLKDGEACNWKRHYRNCAREVIGYLESLAILDSERFVFASVPDIVKHCNRKRNKQPYRRRAVEYAMKQLQEQLVLGEQVERFRKNAMRPGWLVTPHATATLLINNRCDFKGQRHWEREIVTERQPDGGWEVISIGPVQWTDYASGKPLETNTENAGVRCGVRWESPKCAVRCAVEDEKTSPQPIVDASVAHQVCGASRVSRGQSAVESINLTTPVESGSQAVAAKGSAKPNSKTGRVGGVEEKGVNDETIGQHFNVAAHPGFQSITAGLLNTKTEAWGRFAGTDDLLLICWDVIAEFSGQPYLGRSTNALVMSLAMQRFNAAHGEVPPSWLKVLNDLKRGI
jgi:hypothetical protein